MAFANSRNNKIYNSTFAEVHGDYYDNVGSVSISKPEPGLFPLFDVTSPGAAFDSGERSPPAKCHPGTRTEIIEEIMTWIDEVNPSLEGDEDEVQGNESGDEREAGSGGEHSNEDVGCCPSVRVRSGKLAITQFVQDCAKRATLAASFFFSRGRDSHKNQGIVNDEDSLRGLCSEVPSRHGPAAAGESTITQTATEAERGRLAAGDSFPRGQASRHSDDEHWSRSDDENSTRDMGSGSMGVGSVDELDGRQDRALWQGDPADASKSTNTPTISEEDWETDEQLNRQLSMNEDQRVLWLHGPAGAGKSAIAQTVAEACAERGLLAGSFFFSRGRQRRDCIDHLFVTIAYQLAISIPQFKPILLRNLTDDLSILHKDIASQLKKLIIEPLRSAMSSSRTTSQPQSPPYIVIIDGLDECTGTDFQTQILAHIHDIVCHSDLPIRFLVVSRPEYNIQEAFDGAPLSQFSAKRISLYGARKAYHDVRKYLLHEFERIYMSPMHRPWMDVPNPWPSIHIVDRLVKQSDGYFIYASTLIKFMDQEDLSPIDQLGIILMRSSESESSRSFGELDKLYQHVLSTQRNTKLLKMILAAILTEVHQELIAELFCLDPGQVSVTVRRLRAVLTSHSTYSSFGTAFTALRPIHASFSDFIFDPARAGIFHIDPQSIWAQTTRAMLHCIERCAWTSEGSPLTVKPEPPSFEAAAVKHRSPLFEAACFAFPHWFRFFLRAGEAHCDTLLQEITAMNPQRWVPLPPEGQHLAWHDKPYDDLKYICGVSFTMLFDATGWKMARPHDVSFVESRLKQYLDTVCKMAFRRLLAPLHPQDERIVYAFTIMRTRSDDARWIHEFLRLEHPLPYRTLEIYEILSCWQGSQSHIYNPTILGSYLSRNDAPSELFVDLETSHTHLAHYCMPFLTEDVDHILARAHQGLVDQLPECWDLDLLSRHYSMETKPHSYAKLRWAYHLESSNTGDERLMEHLRTIDRRFLSDEEYFSGGIACLEGCKKESPLHSSGSWPPDQHTQTYAQLLSFTGREIEDDHKYGLMLTDIRMIPLWFIRNDVANATRVISWLKKSSNTPQGLVERWEDYHKTSRTRLEHKAREFLQGRRGFRKGDIYGRELFKSLYRRKPLEDKDKAVQFLAEIFREYERDYEAEASSNMSSDSSDNCKSSQLANIVFDLTWVHRRTQAHMSLKRNNVGTRGNEEEVEDADFTWSPDSWSGEHVEYDSP